MDLGQTTSCGTSLGAGHLRVRFSTYIQKWQHQATNVLAGLLELPVPASRLVDKVKHDI